MTITRLKEIILSDKEFKFIGKQPIDCINEAQQALKMEFPQQLLEYLETYGTLIYKAQEFNGLGTDGYLNIVNNTLQEKGLSEKFPDKHVVFHNLGFEGLIIILNEKGEVYEWTQHERYNKIFDTLEEYILNLLRL